MSAAREVVGSSNGVMTTRPMLASQIHLTALRLTQKWMGQPTKSTIQSLPVSNVAMLGTGLKIVHSHLLNALLLMEEYSIPIQALVLIVVSLVTGPRTVHPTDSRAVIMRSGFPRGFDDI
ncbi:hypothetical protein KY290_002459 [Solanum tuberosum]|uniref:Uncharacterized protein n=1 Tax=Solanum tuberosum TaxID=4113 RepID=A0ABQ7WQ48_SOLTU|nr:hypothetical protein KY284_002522 [Solanum tuberosum]KAH0731445.1 hypothetical protein KY289_002633 [Solanum tuberosum]KAH0766499.1 hypothetical protein KY285_002370 [Solanum tuberosum]KAH0782861.1 hypothetical protein KY290_002459 [Solanum tuberosum]